MKTQYWRSFACLMLVWVCFLNYQYFYYTENAKQSFSQHDSANTLKDDVIKIRKSVEDLNKMLDNISSKTLSIIHSRNWLSKWQYSFCHSEIQWKKTIRIIIQRGVFFKNSMEKTSRIIQYICTQPFMDVYYYTFEQIKKICFLFIVNMLIQCFRY